MHKTRVSLLIGALLAAGVAPAQETKEAPKLPADATIATVNGVAYPLEQFQAFFVERLRESQGQNDTAFQQQAFNDFMTLVVAAQEAEKRKLQDDAAVSQAVAAQRLNTLTEAAFTTMMKDIAVSEDELKAAYEQYKKVATRTEYKARHILVKDEAEAKKVIKELEKGADFGELAKQKSEGAKSDGDLEWFSIEMMPLKPFADAVAKMQPGTYSKAPVKTDYGWHIINLQETRIIEPPKFEEIDKAALTARVQQQKLEAKLLKEPGVAATIAVQRMGTLFEAVRSTIASGIKVTEDELKKAYQQIKESAADAKGVPSFEAAKSQLTAMLQRQKAEEQIAKLRDSSLVETNDEVVKVSKKGDEEQPNAESKDAAGKK